jgi:hypothetical protein
MLGIHSKCLDGSMTVTAWRRDNLIAAVRPAKLPPTIAMRLCLRLRFSVMGLRVHVPEPCAVWSSAARGKVPFGQR